MSDTSKGEEKIQISLPYEVFERLKVISEEEGKTISALVREILVECFDNKKKEKLKPPAPEPDTSKSMTRYIDVINEYANYSNGMTLRDIRLKLLKEGIPTEVVYRIDEHLGKLFKHTVKIGNKVIKIGRAILGAILRFIKKYPGFTFGVAMGIAFSAFVSLFVGWIPVVGGLLTTILSILSPIIGGLIGEKFDPAIRKFIELVEELIEAFKKASREVVA